MNTLTYWFTYGLFESIWHSLWTIWNTIWSISPFHIYCF